ncbi:GNAT family acetyltransferase [Halorubrum sp. JWXQ-INN 858]|uniref:DUF5816 domain-containing protein n=1 Tax=Halorubrum sp. JWXQ-INN 858 TaxID=2690782 RepID=UPI00135C5A37|nr:DUF5816 domain-containing protein [Halorubrum sp. JWXQ-INN 858]MWV63239.1 GNAT family acetyltransferase [Halorubrum sp. JWXQ-INN 858]
MELEAATTGENERVYIDRGHAERGAEGRFYVVFSDDSRQDRWGFYCDNCGSLDTAVDTMGRIECNDCGNLRKADEWDAAHE